MFEFELPDVGEGVAEGELIEWHVGVGDRVEEDEVLAEVETDKAIVDLPSPVAGTIRELHAEEGDVVPVGEVVVTIDVDGEVPEESEVEPEAAGTEPESGEPTEESEQEPAARGGRVFAPPSVRRLARELGVDVTAVAGSGPSGRVTEGDVREAADAGGSDDEEVASAVSQVGEDDGSKSAVSKAGDGDSPKSAVSKAGGDGTERKSAVRKASDEAGGDEAATGAADRERTLAAPATRKLAEEEGVDIDAVPTDETRDGEPFVAPEDVRAYAENQRAAQQSEAEAVSETPAAGAAADTEAAVEGTAAAADGEVRREPYRGIRRRIGRQMERSVDTAPHVSHHDTAVVDDLVATRADLKPRAKQRGVGLTYLPFVMKAVVAGLKEYPVLNSTLDEESEEIIYKQFYNVGIATATDDGLLVPVVENVDEKGVLELAAEASDLAERARDRDLAREEMQGGTFTVTNFGAIGGEYATPIINHPETAILGLGSIEQRPVVRDDGSSDDAASTGEVAAAHTLPLSLSIDHRVIDGAEAARFVNTVVEYLENPQLLLLE